MKIKIAIAFVAILSWKVGAQVVTNAPSASSAFTDATGHKMQPQDAQWLKSQGWTDEQIASAIPIQNFEEALGTYKQLTNYYHTAHFNDYQIGPLKVVVPTSPQNQISTISIIPEVINAQPVQPQTNQSALSPTPPDFKNAMVFVDSFLGTGKTGFPADVISLKKNSLKFRFAGKDFDYSGDFSILLITPRQHKNPYFGLGKPEIAKLLTLEDFFKGETDGTMILQNATIWEKSDGFIDVVAEGKEWIHSGNYSITN